MKKIAIIFPKDSEAVFNIKSTATFGGATAQMYNIARELSKHLELKVYSIISDYQEINFPDSDKFTFIKTFKNNSNAVKKIFIYHRVLRSLKPDFMLQRGLTLFSCLLALYCRIAGIKFIFMFAHDREVHGRYQKNNRKCPVFSMLLKNSSRLIAQSKFQKNRLMDNFDVHSEIIQSGYEIKKIINAVKTEILWVGRIEPWKRPEKFIEIAMNFKNHAFIMIAPAIKGYELYSRSVYEAAERAGNIKIIPFVPFSSIDEYFSRAKVFVNTSESEGFPNTFIQACRNGVPILSLNVNPDDFINKNNCGFFCGDDMQLIKKSLKEMLDNESMYRRLSANALKYAAEQHDIEKNMKLLAGLLLTENSRD